VRVAPCRGRMMALWQLIFLFRVLAPAAAATVAEDSDEFANLSLIGDQVVPLDVEPPQRDSGVLPNRSTLALQWTPPSPKPSPLQFYELEYDDGYGPNWTSSLLLPAAYTSYELTGLVPGGRYRVRLRVATLEGWSRWSPEAGFFACEPPGPPSGLESSWNSGGLRPYLTWIKPKMVIVSNAAEDLGGGFGVQDHLRIVGYVLWLQLPEEFDGNRSAALDLATSGPPGAPGAPELDNVSETGVYLLWAPPTLRELNCNGALPACQEASAYELYWDAGSGSLPDQLLYSGSLPMAEIAALPLTAPGDLMLMDLPMVSCNFWYEIQVLNVALQTSFSLTSGLAEIDITELDPLELYDTCRPWGPTAPYIVNYDAATTEVTVGRWSTHPNATWQPFTQSFRVLAAPSADAEFFEVASVSVNAPPVYFKLVAVDSSGTWSLGFDSATARLLCVARLSLLRSGRRDMTGMFAATVDLTLAGQTSETMALHSGWHLQLTRLDVSEVPETTIITDTSITSYTFPDLPPGTPISVEYAVISLAGTGDLYTQANTAAPKPVLKVDWSTNELVSLSWTWSPGIDNDELMGCTAETSGYHVFADWRDGTNYFDPLQPTFGYLPVNTYVVNCTDSNLFGASRSQEAMWFRVAAVTPGGVGELSDAVFRKCSQANGTWEAVLEPPASPASAGAGYTRGPAACGTGMVGAESVYNAPVTLLSGCKSWSGTSMDGHVDFKSQWVYPLNVSANLSQPCRFSVRAVSEVGESPMSPFLTFDKLALPPLPPRLSIRSSTDTQVVVEWSLDRSKERGAYHTGYYVYVSVDGTTWPNEDTGYVATWQDEQTTEWPPGVLRDEAPVDAQDHMSPLSTAISQRCSSPPSAPQNLTMNMTVFDSSGATGSMYVARRRQVQVQSQNRFSFHGPVVWEEPADLHEAVLLGYNVYVDDGNSLDTKDIFYLAEVIDDPERRVFRQDHIVPSRTYKQRGLYKITAITEVGEGDAAVESLVPSSKPRAAPVASVLDDCTIPWWTSKALCPYPQRYQLTIASVDVREDADITSPRLFPFVTVTQGTILEVTEERLGADGRMYLSIPSYGGWLYDDTPLNPGSPLAERLPSLKAQWTWPDEEEKAIGGSPITAWRVYRSTDGIIWSDNFTAELSATARNVSIPCEVSEITVPFWLRVTAVNNVGEGPPSNAAALRCSLPPGLQPAPIQVGSDITSILLEFQPADLHNATYAHYTDGLHLEEKSVHVTGLRAWHTYTFKVQAITESGISPDPDWQVNMSTGWGSPLGPGELDFKFLVAHERRSCQLPASLALGRKKARKKVLLVSSALTLDSCRRLSDDLQAPGAGFARPGHHRTSSAASTESASSAGSAGTACTIDVHNAGDIEGYVAYGVERVLAWLDSVPTDPEPQVKVQPHRGAEEKAELVRQELLSHFLNYDLDSPRVSVSPSASIPESPVPSSDFEDAVQERELHRESTVSVERCRCGDRPVVFKKYLRGTMPTYRNLLEQQVYELNLYYKDLKGISTVVQIHGHFFDPLHNMTFVFPDLGTNHYPTNTDGMISYMRQMLVGLDALWRRNIVHCNIKGGSKPNASFDSHGKLTLIDFESAVRRHELIDQGQNGMLSYRGNPYYVAPEVLVPQIGESPYGQTRFGRRRDVFSAGIVLAELILDVRHLFVLDDDYDMIIAAHEGLRDKLECNDPHRALLWYGGFMTDDDDFNELGADLVAKMLAWHRTDRPAPRELLNHELFWLRHLQACPQCPTLLVSVSETPDPPTYVYSDGSILRIGFSSLTQNRQWSDGADVPDYNLYITADDRGWPDAMMPAQVSPPAAELGNQTPNPESLVVLKHLG
ncbi:MAP3K19, partial [Symbiodinium sp. CCMP2456]